jgi:hypothetical protein
MTVNQRIGASTLASCTVPELIGLAVLKNCVQLDRAESSYELEMRLSMALDYIAGMSAAQKAGVVKARMRILSDLEAQGVRRDPRR